MQADSEERECRQAVRRGSAGRDSEERECRQAVRRGSAGRE